MLPDFSEIEKTGAERPKWATSAARDNWKGKTRETSHGAAIAG
jgi:hypothetical protein